MRNRSLGTKARRTTSTSIQGKSSALIKRVKNLGDDADYRFFYDWTVGNLDAKHDNAYLYRLPYREESGYRVLQGFNSSFSHTGLESYTVDFNTPVGTPVHAARGGVVARLEESHAVGCWRNGCGKYANYLVILHSDGTTGEYYHLKKGGVLLEQGDRVTRGQLIAISGNTGHTTMPHLHFGVYKASTWGSTRSVPIRFDTDRGVVDRPRMGQLYRVRPEAGMARETVSR